MAIFHANLSYFSRSKGKAVWNGTGWESVSFASTGGLSAVAAAAYRAGALLTDERRGVVADYRAKGGVLTSFMTNAGGHDRQSLWNAAEAREKRYDARTASEWDIALPHELTHDERLALCRQLAQDMADRWGVAVDTSIHLPSREGDQRNHHAHFLFTTRRMGADGVLGEKVRELDARKTAPHEVRWFRENVASRMNAALAAGGHAERVDHRSFKAQGREEKPSIHVGPRATALRRRGIRPESGEWLVNDKGHKFVGVWSSIDHGQTRHEFNLWLGAVEGFTAEERLKHIRAELAKGLKAVDDAKLKQKIDARAPRPRFARNLQKAMKGQPSESKLMMAIAAIFAELFASLFAGLAAAAVEKIVNDGAIDYQQLKALRSHNSHLRRLDKKWSAIAEKERLAAAGAGPASAEQGPTASRTAGQKPAQQRRKRRRRLNDSAERKERAQTKRFDDMPEHMAAKKAQQRTRPQKRWRPPAGAAMPKKPPTPSNTPPSQGRPRSGRPERPRTT